MAQTDVELKKIFQKKRALDAGEKSLERDSATLNGVDDRIMVEKDVVDLSKLFLN